ncbi:MAG TPA: hypothetical protein VNU68_27205 [Verrucomicrobiae bacterium]|nr:hypothetical protein [Verrucomicrobiae bacterium]
MAIADFRLWIVQSALQMEPGKPSYLRVSAQICGQKSIRVNLRRKKRSPFNLENLGNLLICGYLPKSAGKNIRVNPRRKKRSPFNLGNLGDLLICGYLRKSAGKNIRANPRAR